MHQEQSETHFASSHKGFLRLLLAAAVLCMAMPAAADDDTVDYIDEDYEDAWDDYAEVDGQDYVPASPQGVIVQDDGTVLIIDDGTAYYDQEDAPDAILIDDTAETEQVSASSGIALSDLNQADREAQEAVDKVRSFLERAQLPLDPADELSINTYLTDLEQFVSPTGSDGELLASRYIRAAMEGMGYTVTEQTFHEGFLNDDYTDVPGINLIAERGADSEFRTDDIIVLCAHYDSKTKPDENDPLANDKTGTAVLLETARILSGVSSDVDVCFLFLSGEEDGYYGSARFIEKLDDSLKARISSVICIGPVGYHYLPEYGPGTDHEKLSYLLGADPLEGWDENEVENEEATDPVSDAIEETDPAVAAGEEADLVSDIITSDGLIAEEAGTGNANAAMPIDAILVDGIEKEMENEAGNLYRATVLLDRADMVAAGEAIPEDTLGLLPRHEIALQTPNMPFYLAADWTFVPDYESCRANFSRAGIPAFSLFQNLDGNYRRNKTGEIIYLPLTEETAQPEENTPPANDSQSEAEEAPSLVTDLTDLAKITDLTARVASYYMRAL